MVSAHKTLPAPGQTALLFANGYSMEQLRQKLSILRQAIATDDDETVREAMKQVVPTYRSPEEVNAKAEQAEEMRMQKEPAPV